MALLDHNGNEIQFDQLLEEEARPSLTGVRTVMAEHVTQGMTPQRMLRCMNAADEGDIESYLAMAEEIEEKDAHYLSVLGTRKRAVAQMEITVEDASDDPADKANGDLVRSWLKRDEIEGEIFDMMDAVSKGFSATEIIWDRTPRLWLPKELTWRDPRWFLFDRADGTTLRLRDGTQGKNLTPYKFVVHYHQAKSGLPIRSGVVRVCAWMWLFKNFSIKDWVIFAEAFGQPIRVGKYGPGASAEDRAVLKRAVANIGSDIGAIIPESMIIEFVESQGKQGTIDLFEKLCNFCDTQMSKAVLGQTTTTDQISGGGIAGNAAHNEVREDIARADAKQIAATLNKQLIMPFITLNRGPQKDYPRIRIGRAEDVDTDKVSNAIDRVVRLGGKVSARKSVEKLGLPTPEGDDDVLKAEAPAPAIPGYGPSFASQRRELAAAGAAQDAISQLAEAEAGDWEEVLNPITATLEEALKSSSSYEEFAAKMLEIAPELNIKTAAEKIARMVFAARAAGQLGVKLEK